MTVFSWVSCPCRAGGRAIFPRRRAVSAPYLFRLSYLDNCDQVATSEPVHAAAASAQNPLGIAESSSVSRSRSGLLRSSERHQLAKGYGSRPILRAISRELRPFEVVQGSGEPSDNADLRPSSRQICRRLKNSRVLENRNRVGKPLL